jgi:uncharacterized small protein (DUF1192 family)
MFFSYPMFQPIVRRSRASLSVREQLASFGVSPSEVDARVAALSDEEIARIAGKIDEMPAGQGAVEVVLIAALIIFLMLLITDILGLTDVFPFVKHW